MAIEFKTPEIIEKQLRQVHIVAENVMRPESRVLDDLEHERPVKFINMMWPSMIEMERNNLRAASWPGRHASPMVSTAARERTGANGSNGTAPRRASPTCS